VKEQAERRESAVLKRLAILGLTVAALIFALAIPTLAADHIVTVTISAINEISVTGAPSLTVSTATAGQDLDDDVDLVTCDLSWTTNAANKKITVATTLAPSVTLKVVAVAPTAGSAAAEVTLSTTAADFITGIGKTFGTSDITYTLAASVTDAIVTNETITVTYTITAV
jgi:hypothetical protein